MNFVSSMPASHFGIEQTIYQLFGVNVPAEAVIVAAAVGAVTLVFKSSLISSGLR